MDEDTIREMLEQRDRNIAHILENHHQRMNEIKRSGHRLRLWLCPLIALFFGVFAWYMFTTVHDVVMSIIYAGGGLAFLLMLLFGAIFDRPS